MRIKPIKDITVPHPMDPVRPRPLLRDPSIAESGGTAKQTIAAFVVIGLAAVVAFALFIAGQSSERAEATHDRVEAACPPQEAREFKIIVGDMRGAALREEAQKWVRERC